ncbi:MAG: ABC transporter permease subunit [Armatimonadetes bacterium]|nr:ABC transporter permease subunit [Armatimonadota bacterium]
MRAIAALRTELSKLFRQRITWASFAVVLVLVALITWGSHHERERIDVENVLGDDFVVAGETVTALFVAHAVMEVAMVVLIPLLVAVVVGGLVAGERQTGTLRTLLARPVSRTTILLGKLAAAWSYTIMLVLALGGLSLGLGRLVFGWGDLVIFRGGLTILDPHTGLVRLAMAYGLAAFAMCAVAALALLSSVIFDNPMTAAGLTVALLLVSGIVAQMPYFEAIEPHLITSHLQLYREVLGTEVDRAELVRSAIYLGAYMTVSLAIAVAVFQRRDVTC